MKRITAIKCIFFILIIKYSAEPVYSQFIYSDYDYRDVEYYEYYFNSSGRQGQNVSNIDQIFVDDYIKNAKIGDLKIKCEPDKNTNYERFLSIKNTTDKPQMISKSFSIDESKDYQVETTIEYMSGNENSECAFLWSMNEKNYTGIWFVQKTMKGNKHFDFSFASRGEINKEYARYADTVRTGFLYFTYNYHKLTIRKVKDVDYIFIDEGLIKYMPHQPVTGSELGFIAGPKSCFRVSVLKLGYLLGNEVLPDTSYYSIRNKKQSIIEMDDFIYKNQSNWNFSETTDGKCSPDIGYSHLEIRIKDTMNWSFINKINIDQSKDFEIEADILNSDSQKKKYYIDLVWGANEALEKCYLFSFNENGVNKVCKKTGDIYQNYYEKWTGYYFCFKNLMTIRKKGNKLMFFVNRHFIYSCDFDPFFGPGIGFQTPSSIYIDYIKVLYFD